MLDVFKTQKTLDKAEDVLEQAKESNTSANSEAQATGKGVCQSLLASQRSIRPTTLIWQTAQPIVEDLTDFRTKLLPQASGGKWRTPSERSKNTPVAVKSLRARYRNQEGLVHQGTRATSAGDQEKRLIFWKSKRPRSIMRPPGSPKVLITQRWNEICGSKSFLR